jgi:CBS domain-containing protein
VKVGALMRRDFETIHPDAAVHEVAARLEAAGALPVSERGRLLGMLRRTDLDEAPVEGHEIPLRGERSARFARVRDRVAPDVLYCLETTEAAEAFALMREKNVDRLPVLDARHQIVGILELHADGSRPLDGAARSAGP